MPDFSGRPAFITSIGKAPVDINLLPAQGRRKKLLIADMDSTMIQQECIDELGDMAGVGERIKEITIRAMRGELDFEGALNERVACSGTSRVRSSIRFSVNGSATCRAAVR